MRTSNYWFHRLCALEGAIALIALLRIPSEGGSLSPARLVLAGIILALAVSFAILGIRPSRVLENFVRPGTIWTTALLSLVFGVILFLLRYLDPDASLLISLYERLAPLLWYLLALSIQLTLYLLYLKQGFHLNALTQYEHVLFSSLTAFVSLLFILLFVSLTGLGITADDAYWGEPGVPLLGWQLVLAILIGAALLLQQVMAPASCNSKWLNFLVPASIWLSASLLWLNVPIATLRNSFYAPITPPYTTPFPYSDAGYYDYLSQSLLIGTDYFGSVPPRPLYITFLAGLHLLFGQDYLRIIAGQTLVFALFPVALYFLGLKLHSRAAGVAAAFFAIFRELTTLWISSNTRTASTKMFVTDFATATAIAFTCLAAIRWFERRDTKSALVAGGSFGLLLLLRTQSLIILPFLFIVAYFVHEKDFKQWFRAGASFGAAMLLAVTPWLAHNYTVTRRFTFDDPSQMAVIYSQYSHEGNLDISQFDFESESLGSRLISFTLENPAFVGGFIANHFLNTEIGGVLALPLIERFNGLFAPIHLYWIEWDGSLAWYNFVLIVAHLAIAAVGMGAAWARWRWMGLVPLTFNVGYALANGISRFSSWRYNLPVDWIAYFYFGIGILEIVFWLARTFGAPEIRATEVVSERPNDRAEAFRFRNVLSLAVFVFIGSLPWLAKGIMQPRYTSTADELKIQAAFAGMDVNALEEFLSQPNTTLLEGRTLYPRFFRRNDGIFSSNPWPVYKVREFARIGFLVLNSSANSVIFPVNKPLAFPHGSDAIVLGCTREDYIEARWIYFPESDDLFMSELPFGPCDS